MKQYLRNLQKQQLMNHSSYFQCFVRLGVLGKLIHDDGAQLGIGQLRSCGEAMRSTSRWAWWTPIFLTVPRPLRWWKGPWFCTFLVWFLLFLLLVLLFLYCWCCDGSCWYGSWLIVVIPLLSFIIVVVAATVFVIGWISRVPGSVPVPINLAGRSAQPACRTRIHHDYLLVHYRWWIHYIMVNPGSTRYI